MVEFLVSAIFAHKNFIYEFASSFSFILKYIDNFVCISLVSILLSSKDIMVDICWII